MQMLTRKMKKSEIRYSIAKKCWRFLAEISTLNAPKNAPKNIAEDFVDLGESFPTSIYLQKSASIQPRTSLTKFGGKLNSIFIRLLNGYALYSVDFLVCRAFVFEICAALFEALQREGSRIFFFVHDILRHGSRKSAEEAIFKADNWNTLRQFELLFTVLRVGATRSRNARVERAFVDPAQQLPLRSSAKNPRGILILVPVFPVRSSARRFW